MAFFVIVGGISGLIAWFYRRGKHENSLEKALEANTKANAENTESNHQLSRELRDFKAETLATLRDHDWRIKILEDRTDN